MPKESVLQRSPVDVNNFVPVVLHTNLVSLILISVPVEAADFRCELDLQVQGVRMPGGKERVVESSAEGHKRWIVPQPSSSNCIL